jgi:hypothetical protein
VRGELFYVNGQTDRQEDASSLLLQLRMCLTTVYSISTEMKYGAKIDQEIHIKIQDYLMLTTCMRDQDGRKLFFFFF